MTLKLIALVATCKRCREVPVFLTVEGATIIRRLFGGVPIATLMDGAVAQLGERVVRNDEVVDPSAPPSIT